jgi:transposase
MDTLVECTAGLDVHRDTVVATVRRRDGPREPIETRTFETYPDELRALAQWLIEQRVQIAGIESTGVYFKPVDRELRRAGLTVWVVNAAHAKQVPGRKTDVSDSAWLSKLVMHGLLRPSFIPDESLEGLRMLTRARVQTVHERTRAKNRIIKLLEAQGIKLAGICSDVLGKSGRAILSALLDGQMTPAQMADLAQGHLRIKRPLLERALQVRLGPDAGWVLRDLLTTFEQIEQRIERFDTRIAQTLSRYADDVQLLRQIPGLDTISIGAVLAESGPDMSVFASAKHLVSWAGLAPGSNESAGKAKPARVRRGNPWLRTILVQIAWVVTRTRHSPWRGTLARIARQTGSVKKAALAIARKILLTVYHVLTSRQYKPTPPPPPSEPDRRRQTQRALATLKSLGFRVTLEPLQIPATSTAGA